MSVFRIVRIVMAVVAILLTVYAVVDLDYRDLSWTANHSSYLVIVMGVTGTFNLLFFDFYRASQQKKIGR